MDSQRAMLAFEIIEGLDLAELDQTIEWLENALLAYKTLRAVKSVHESRPTYIEPVSSKDSRTPWVSAVDMDRQDRSCNPTVRKITVAQFDVEMSELLLRCSHGVASKQLIAAELHLSNCQIGKMMSCTKRFCYRDDGLIREVVRG